MKKIIFGSLFVALVLAGKSFVFAGMPTPGEVELTRASIELRRKAIVEANMGLDEKTAEVFWPLYNGYHAEKTKINSRMDKILVDYAANWLDLSDEKAKELMNEVISIQEAHVRLKKKWSKKFLKDLSAKVTARYFQIEQKLDSIAQFELAENVPLVH